MIIRSISFVLALLGAAAAYGQQPLTLSDVTREALARNPSVLLAKQRVTEVEGRVKEMRGQGSPGIVAGASAGQSHGNLSDPPSANTFNTEQASLTVNLPNSRKAQAAVVQAESQLAAARAQLTRATLDISFRSTSAFYEVLRAKGGVAIATANRDQIQRQVADTQARIDAGDVPPADLLKVQVSAAQSSAAFQKAQSAYHSSLQTLNSLLVHPLNEEVALVLPDGGAAGPKHDDVLSAALSASPDVLEATANLKAAEAGLSLSKRANDPALSLQGSYTKTTDPTTYSGTSSVMLALSLPIFDGGILGHQIAQAKSQLEQARSNLSLAKQSVQLQTEQAYLDFVSDQTNLAASSETLRIAQISFDKARQSYDAGLTTTRDVLDAQLALAQAKSDTANAQFDLAIAHARLQQLMGIAAP